MVLSAAYDERLTIKVGENSAEVVVEFGKERFIAQKRAAVLSGEDRMDKNLGEGLRHGR